MLRSFESLEFIKSHADRFEIQVCTQSKLVETPFYGQAFQFENGVQNGKDMVILCDDPADGRFAQSGILLERFMEDFHRPSFWIDR
jgi:hypothetical protein